jgi:hypothetical protein
VGGKGDVEQPGMLESEVIQGERSLGYWVFGKVSDGDSGSSESLQCVGFHDRLYCSNFCCDSFEVVRVLKYISL